MADIYPKQYLMTAGPTPLPPAVSPGDGRADPLPPRAGLHRDLRARPRRDCPRSSRPTTTCSASPRPASGALESAVANLSRARASPRSSPPAGSSASAGRSSARRSAPTSTHVEFEWGEKVDPARVDEALGVDGREAEGRLHDPVGDLDRGAQRHRGAAEVARAHGAILCVDAVSGLGAADLPQDEWGVDVVVSGSQKSLMCPPGLGFASVSERALDARRGRTRRPLLLRLGQDGDRAARSRRRTRRSRPP